MALYIYIVCVCVVLPFELEKKQDASIVSMGKISNPHFSRLLRRFHVVLEDDVFGLARREIGSMAMGGPKPQTHLPSLINSGVFGDLLTF